MHVFTPNFPDIVAHVHSQLAAHNDSEPLGILIDGPSGSGKSTLANELVHRLAKLKPALVRMEDLYLGWDGLNTGIARASLELLEPHGLGLPATFQSYDWQRARLGYEKTVSEKRMLILEGCGSFGAANPDDAYIRIWVAADDDVRKERALSRGGENYAEHWQMWDDQFAVYEQSFAPSTQASLVVRAAE